MRIYIIHSPKTSENYFERIRATEEMLLDAGHYVLNPLPENVEQEAPDYDNADDFKENAPKINICDVVYAMEGYAKEDIGNKVMAEAMVLRKTIAFEQVANAI